jgi:hypothetical protein
VCGYKAQLLQREEFRDRKLGYMYGTVWEGLLDVVREPDVPRPTATTVAILPIVFDGTEALSTVIVAGFDDGILRFYRESGTLMFSHQLHKEKIRELTYSVSLKHGVNVVKQDELVVLYQTVVCVVSGPSLVQCVKECFNYNLLDKSEKLELPSLAYKKWHLQQQTETCDVVSLVSSPLSVFDQLSQLSKVKGADANLRGVIPIDRKVIAVGSQPMVALYNVSKDASSIHMTEVVSALTTALTSAVVSKVSSYSSWLGWGSKAGQSTAAPKPPQQVQRVEPTSSVSMSCHLPDTTRRVTRIWPSPCGRLLVTTDDFGRVLLISTNDFTILRMWKGYRSAQCGWIEVADNERDQEQEDGSSARSTRTVLCLCIYAAKRGIVELWPVQNGPRIAAFLVGKGCRLLQVHPVLFGKGSHSCTSSVVFITVDGQIVSLAIPQHLLLRSGHTHSRDLLLLRKLPQSIGTSDSDFIATVFDTMQSSRLILKAVDVLINDSPQSGLPVYFIAEMIGRAVKRLPPDITPGSPTSQLKDHLTRIRQIVVLYTAIRDVSKQHKSKRHYCELLRENLVSLCGIPPSLSGSLTTALNSYFRSHQLVFPANPLTLKEFAHCFKTEYRGPDLLLSKDLPAGSDVEDKQDGKGRRLVLRFHPKLEGSLLARLGFFLFEMIMRYDDDEMAVVSCYQDFGLQAADLLNALSGAWLSKEISFGNSPYGCLVGLRVSLKALVEAGSSPSVEWTSVGLYCQETPNYGHALLLAVVSYAFARAQSQDQNIQDKKEELEQAASEGWETVVEEDDEWFHLLQELEFLTRLSLLGGSVFTPHCPVLPVLSLYPQGRSDIDQIKSTLMGNTDKGDIEMLTVAHLKDHKSEVVNQTVADWLVSGNINPIILESVHCYKEGIEKHLTEEEQLILSKTRQLFQCSPVALDVDVLRVNCVWQVCAHCNIVTTEGASDVRGLQQNIGKLECAMNHLLQISSVSLMAAAGHLLWAKVFRTYAMDLIQTLKKKSLSAKEDLKLVSLARQLLGVLLQLCSFPSNSASDESSVEEAMIAKSFDLVQMLSKSPPLNLEVVEVHYIVLICLELSIALDMSQIHIVRLFDIWVQELVGCNLTEEAVKKKKGRTISALKHNQLKFLTKALTAYVGRMKVCGAPPPYLKPSCEAVKELATSDVIFTTWPGLIYHMADYLAEGVSEEVGVLHIGILFSSGLDQDAMEAMKYGIRSKLLSEKLLSVAMDRLQICLAEEPDIPKKATATSLLAPQVLDWMSKQSKQKTIEPSSGAHPSWASTNELLNIISNNCELTGQQLRIIDNLKLVVSHLM